MERIGMRGVVGSALENFAMPGVTGCDDSLQQGLDFVSEWKHHKLISPALAPHAPYSVTKKQFAEARKASNDRSVPISMHVLETQKEAEDLRKSWGADPLVKMAKQGLLDGPTVFAHMFHPTKKDLKALKKFDVGIAHCPHSNLKLADGIAPLHEMIDMDLAVGIGTDRCASNNRLDIWSELKTTALVQKTIQNDPTVLPAREALPLPMIARQELSASKNKLVSSKKTCAQILLSLIWIRFIHFRPTM
jgi:5-methylthioadenosine/S-adenosylhomocysteine deaminase